MNNRIWLVRDINPAHRHETYLQETETDALLVAGELVSWMEEGGVEVLDCSVDSVTQVLVVIGEPGEEE